ncbi:unnamed protein product, partial [Meganyctiphanes norvegica]
FRRMQLTVVLVSGLALLVKQIRSQGISANCLCTPFFRCYDNEANSNLDGLADDRTIIAAKPANEPSVCPVILDVCCHNLVPPPQSQQQTPPQVPIQAGSRQPLESHEKCGVRNSEGVGFTVSGFTEGQAQYGEFPWMVALLQSNTGSGTDQVANNLYLGGGSLIDPLVVLTVAHKPHDLELNQTVTVRVGEWNFRAINEPNEYEDIPVRRIIYHPRFNREQRSYNYALLILERPAKMGETVGTICLPPNPVQRFDGQQCIISGWGKDVFGDEGRYQKILKLVNVNMVDHSQCQTAMQTTRLGNRFTLHESFICAGDQGQDACTGDGGSPLVCMDPTSPGQYVQVGLLASSMPGFMFW